MYETGSLIDDRYKILAELGKGGMGAVYLVEDSKLDKKLLALKLLDQNVSQNVTLIKRFKNEANITQEFKHENVVTTHHYGETQEGEYYFTMDYVQGTSLGDIIYSDDRASKLNIDKILKYLYSIAEALSYAHEKNIVHRDLKPDNILITKDDKVKLSDFGIARDLNDDKKLTRTNEMVGTIYYMTPEQIRGDKIDHRVDIYALGILAFEMAAGNVPFESDNYHALCVSHLTQELPQIAGKEKGIPYWYQDFVNKCCAKDPKDRYQTMKEVMEALDEYYYSSRQLSYLLYQVRRKWGALPIKAKNYFVATIIGFIYLFLMTPVNGFGTGVYLNRIIEPKIMNYWFMLRGRIDPPKDVVVITVDEKSHEMLGASLLAPWPRINMAKLLEALVNYKPKAVIFDYRFPEIIEIKTDQRIAEAMKRVPTYTAKFKTTEDKINIDGKLERVTNWIESDPLFLKNQKGSFRANLPISAGIVRYFNFYEDTKFKIPSIAEVLYKENIEDRDYPTLHDFVNYYGPPGSIKRVSFYEVLDQAKPIAPELFKDKYLFVGKQLFLPSSGQQEADTFFTPFDQSTAGVEIHASTAGNLLENTWIRRFPNVYELVVSMGILIFLSYYLMKLKPLYAALLLVGSISTWLIASYLLFLNHYFIPGLILMLGILPVIFLFSLMRFYFKLKKLEIGIGLKGSK